MSPKNKKKLNILRRNLDSIDETLLSVIKRRTDIINKVIILKKNKKEIIDKKRINFILKKIRKSSIKKKIDPVVTYKIWKNMIWTYIDYEKKKFEKK
jgi:chorismate mutase